MRKHQHQITGQDRAQIYQAVKAQHILHGLAHAQQAQQQFNGEGDGKKPFQPRQMRTKMAVEEGDAVGDHRHNAHQHHDDEADVKHAAYGRIGLKNDGVQAQAPACQWLAKQTGIVVGLLVAHLGAAQQRILQRGIDLPNGLGGRMLAFGGLMGFGHGMLRCWAEDFETMIAAPAAAPPQSTPPPPKPSP